MFFISQIQKVQGTNCFNCVFISKKDEPVSADELNDQGGIDPKTVEDMQKAEKADLITLPGWSKQDAATKRLCYNEKIKMYVTTRMCCRYWDNKEVRRPWKK